MIKSCKRLLKVIYLFNKTDGEEKIILWESIYMILNCLQMFPILLKTFLKFSTDGKKSKTRHFNGSTVIKTTK